MAVRGGCYRCCPFPARPIHGIESLPSFSLPCLGWLGTASASNTCAQKAALTRCAVRGLAGCGLTTPTSVTAVARALCQLGSVHGRHHEQNSVPKAADLLGCMAERGTTRHRPAHVRSVSWLEERVGNTVPPLPLTIGRRWLRSPPSDVEGKLCVALIGLEGSIHGCTYRIASGGMHGPKRDDPQRRRSAGCRPSIKNESAGIEDDQTPL